MEDSYFGGLLTVTIDTPIALFHSIGIPGNLIVDELGTVILKVNTFRRSVSGKKDTNRGFHRIGLECSFDSLAVFRGHSRPILWNPRFVSFLPLTLRRKVLTWD